MPSHFSRATFPLHCREHGFLPSSGECSGSDAAQLLREQRAFEVPSSQYTARAALYHANDAISIEIKKAITTSEAALNYGMGSNK